VKFINGEEEMSNQIKDVPAAAMPEPPKYEFIGSVELAKRLGLPKSWVDERVRNRTKDIIPHFKFGKYTKFAWGSPDLAEWLRRRKVVSNSGLVNRVSKETQR
jgi:hypothetical protein